MQRHCCKAETWQLTSIIYYIVQEDTEMCLCLFESVIFLDYKKVTILFFSEVLVLFVCKCRAWFVYDGNTGLVYMRHFTK